MGLAELAVFLRSPAQGTVKTRLEPVLGASGAALLYRAFVEDTLSLCARLRELGRIDVALWVDGPPDDVISGWAQSLDAEVLPQPSGDLGPRLAAAFERGLHRYERVVAIGTDAPTLPIWLIVDAFNALERSELVLGPSNDGGYFAIGATRSTLPRFDEVRWSTAAALEDTLAANRGRRTSLLSPWYDVDGNDDLALLRAHLSVSPGAAPATARALSELD